MSSYDTYRIKNKQAKYEAQLLNTLLIQLENKGYSKVEKVFYIEQELQKMPNDMDRSVLLRAKEIVINE